MQKFKKIDIIVLFFILSLALLIRLPGLPYPFPFSGDAYRYLQIAVKFGSGDINPHFFTHPALSFYITYVAEASLFIFSYLVGFVDSASDFAGLFFSNLFPFLVAGRIPSLLFGIGTIYLVYLIGKKIWSRDAALCASIMLTLTPLHIIESQTIRIRSIATFFGILCLFFVFNILEKGRKRDYILAGSSLGFALATEYTMIFFTFPILTVIILRLLGQKDNKEDICLSPKKGLLLICIAALVVFVLSTPFTLFDYPSNVNTFFSNLKYGVETTHYIASTSTDNSYLVTKLKKIMMNFYYTINILFRNDISSMGKVFASVSIAGVMFAIYKRDKKDIILLSLLPGYFLIQPLVVYQMPRMVLMAYPVLILFASRFLVASLEWGCKRNKVQKLVFYLLIFVLVLPNLVWSAKHINQLLQKDTRIMAKNWIEENIPSGSHILIESYKLSNLISLNESKESLYGKYLRYKSIIEKIPNYKGYALLRKKIEMENVQEPAYDVSYFYPRSFGILHDEFTSKIANQKVLSIDEYRRRGIDYVVVARYKPSDDFSSEFMKKRQPEFHYVFETLDQECRLLKTIRYKNSLAALRKPLINPEIKIYTLN